MNTTMLLIVQYDAQTVIPIDRVIEDFFPHLSAATFIRKVARGDIKIPLIRIDGGTHKSLRGVHLNLARYIDDRREAAIKELQTRGIGVTTVQHGQGDRT
jgi:hypothetical protein